MPVSHELHSVRHRARHRGRCSRRSRARGVEEVDAAVARARAALPGLARAGARRAGRSAARARRLLEDRLEELALLEARNAGKPIGDARGEMAMVVDTFRYYAGAPERLLGDTIPVAGGQAWTVREPLGVVGLIVPWNFPLAIASWKLAPALAAGNTVVLKPAELTPLTALRFAEIALRGRHRRRASSTSSPGRAACAARVWSSTPTWRRSPSPAPPRSVARSPPAPRRRSSA